jgi:hypothetical protein
MLNVIHRDVNGKVYANVATISPVPSVIKQNGLPKAINPNQIFTLAEPDMVLFETFGKVLKDKIMGSPEWSMYAGRGVVKSSPLADIDDDLPF